MAGTCWGSWDVGVDEMRKLSARSVANSDATGAMMIAIPSLSSLFPSWILISGLVVAER
jgi:hypothetical protein